MTDRRGSPLPTFDQCLRELAEQRPDHVALIDAEERLSYEQLDHDVHVLAVQLRCGGVVTGSRVALIADNSVRHLVAAFAIWRAGGTLVTVYPSSTETEFRDALTSAHPAMVIAATRLVGSARAAAAGLDGSVHELTIDGAILDLPAVDRDVAADLEGGGEVTGEALALVCFTSGSTAKAKAVIHTHAGLIAAAAAYADVWHLGPADTTLVALPLAWAFGLVTTSMATLVAGGTVVLLARTNPIEMVSNLADHRVTFFAGVTTMFVKMLHTLERDAMVPDLHALRLCISGGEPRNEAAFVRWHEITGCPVHDVYASSECFPVVTYDPLVDPLPRAGCAGRVVPSARMRLVDTDGQDVAPGTAGEAWTKGPATTIGYWGDPVLTASALTPDGWYRTGDLVEIDADGYVYVRGRLTDVIIRGGANVSPAEVEAVLARHPDVLECAVVGLPDEEYGQRVAAAVVMRPRTVLDHDALRRHCGKELAGYKVPSQFVAVAELPRNASTGKVHRREAARLLAAHAPRVGRSTW